MGEWNDPQASAAQMAFFKTVREEERKDFEAWRRGEAPAESRSLEAPAPKHIYAGNRKQRRAQERKDR